MSINSIFGLVAIGMIATTQVVGQVSVASNNGLPANFVGWNAGNNFPLEIRHNGNQHINFFTSSSPRMRLTNGGWLGINTSALLNGDPQMMLHVNNGGILSTGIQGANPNLGSGTRFMWVPSSASVRV
jgi:hypothetical protein